MLRIKEIGLIMIFFTFVFRADYDFLIPRFCDATVSGAAHISLNIVIGVNLANVILVRVATYTIQIVRAPPPIKL